MNERQNSFLMRDRLPVRFVVSIALTNAHTCLYGSQTAKYFKCDPPTLEEYLLPFFGAVDE